MSSIRPDSSERWTIMLLEEVKETKIRENKKGWFRENINSKQKVTICWMCSWIVGEK